MRVEVYRNLHKQCWSVRALEGERKGRVIAHTHDLILEECRYAVQPAGRDKVRRSGRKNVHAFIRGTLPEQPMTMRPGAQRVTYNPYKHDGFVLASIAESAKGSPKWLDGGDVWVGQSSAVRFCADGKVFAGFATKTGG
jgi:hypothetical protein